jgi:hypothetical protein
VQDAADPSRPPLPADCISTRRSAAAGRLSTQRQSVYARFGLSHGCDISRRGEFTHSLGPLLTRCG